MKSLIWGNLFSKRNKKNLTSALRQVMLFENLTNKQIRKIEAIGHIRYFKENEPVFFKGDPAYGMYIVLRGEVAIYAGNIKIQTYKPFDFFGEFAIADENYRTATAISVTSSTLFYISRDELLDLFRQDHRIAFIVYERLIKMFSKIIEKYDELLLSKAVKSIKSK